MPKLQKNPSALKREHAAWNFFIFSTFVGHFALLDPDPDTDPLTWLNPDPIRIRIRNTGLEVTSDKNVTLLL